MNADILLILLVLAALAGGVFLGMFLRKKLSESKVNNARVEAGKSGTSSRFSVFLFLANKT